VRGDQPNRESAPRRIDPRRLSFDEVAEALMRHEKRRWDALAKARDWGSGGAPSEPLRERPSPRWRCLARTATATPLTSCLDRLDRHREALDARTESVRIYRALAARDPDLYRAEYQAKLGALRREYDQRGMRYEAIMHDP